MKLALLIAVSLYLAASAFAADAPTTRPASQPDLLGLTVKTLAGKDLPLANHRGKVLLIVNVASRCGYTPQYKGLQELHEKYAAKGLVVLGLPCNQFGGQEPGDGEQIRQFCDSKYHVTFELLEKADVNGEKACPLYRLLTAADAPIADKGAVKWNFEKFLVGRDGKLIARYRSAVKPEQLAKDIEAALAVEVKP